MDNLFSTHPATENRIAALEALAREMGNAGSRRASSQQACIEPLGGQHRGPWS